MGYAPEWPPPPVTGAARYPLKFRSLLREAYTRGAVGRSVIEQELKLDDGQVDELIEEPRSSAATTRTRNGTSMPHWSSAGLTNTSSGSGDAGPPQLTKGHD